MRRVAAFVLLALALACADATAPSGAQPARVDTSSCLGYLDLVGSRGEIVRIWAKFTPCPSDSAFAATGWTRLDQWWWAR
jgi:hypothetical protein